MRLGCVHGGWSRQAFVGQHVRLDEPCNKLLGVGSCHTCLSQPALYHGNTNESTAGAGWAEQRCCTLLMWQHSPLLLVSLLLLLPQAPEPHLHVLLATGPGAVWGS
jgi:hypothetical protein